MSGAAAEEARALHALAIRLAHEAGALQRARYGSELRIDTKSAEVDLVTEVDRACEELVVAGIARERPEDAVLGEEGGGRGDPDARVRWVVDPLDGTTNFAHGYPRFCVSIGVEREGELLAGVVYDPLMDELFEARAGDGARLNGRPLRVSRETQLGRALLMTGFAYDRRESEVDNLDHLAAFLKSARAVRRDGSAALDLAYVAAGRLDGYWELKLQPWDVAAGGLLVREAGGRVTDADGGEAWRSGRDVVATNGGVHEPMLAVLQKRT